MITDYTDYNDDANYTDQILELIIGSRLWK